MSMLVETSLTIGSPDFKQKGSIPSRFTCEGRNINPAITISSIPTQTKSLVLIVDDPDAPGKTFDHWVLWNISPQTTTIKENSAPGMQGKNGARQNKYMGPCPPSGSHRYFFKVYALDKMLDNKTGDDKNTIEKAMEGHILASGELMGLYQKQNQ